MCMYVYTWRTVPTILYYVGGFDSYVQSGAAPEAIMIGIGTVGNGSGCPDPSNGCQERLYEFSNVACNADGNLDAGYCPWAHQAYGGLDAFLNFTWDTSLAEYQHAARYSINYCT